MKKRMVAIAALSALAAVGARAQNVTISGVADVAARSVHNSQGSVRSVVSGSNSTSRLIIKGTEDLGGGLTAGFWLEGGFSADTGVTQTPFFDRQSTVRLRGTWGEIRLGRDWVPSFLSYASADPMGYVGVGLAGNLISASATTANKRAFGTVSPTTSRSSNAVEYWLPETLGGVYGQVMAAPSENANATGSFKLFGARLGYRKGGADVSAHTTSTRIDSTGAQWRQSGLTTLYSTDSGIKLSAAWVDFRYLSSRQNNLILGVRIPVGVQEFKASYGRADQKGTDAAGASIDANDGRQYALSYVYNLSKRSAWYVNAAHIVNKGAASYAISGGPAGALPGRSHTGYEVGVRHTF